jgi:hypothetical protein
MLSVSLGLSMHSRFQYLSGLTKGYHELRYIGICSIVTPCHSYFLCHLSFVNGMARP